jgi:hypothetical protein
MDVVASQNFEDICISMDEWYKRKAEMPLGQVPVLEIDGVQKPRLML